MLESPDPLPQTLAVLERDRQARLHLGAQLYVSCAGKTIVDLALGEAEPGRTMRPDTVNPWLSAGKPLTAIALAQLQEQGKLSINDTVSHFIPEFAQGGKAQLTIEHLLTHTAGFRTADQLPESLSWDDTIARVCATPLETGWIPGEKAGYQISSSWFVLAEIVRRLDGRPFDRYVSETILKPLGLEDSWVGMTKERLSHYRGRLGLLFVSQSGSLKPHPKWNTEEAVLACRPGSSARGSCRDLAKLYEALLNKLDSKPSPSLPSGWLRSETVAEFTNRRRIGLFDHTFRHKIDWGLGFVINSNRYGATTVPYGYGVHASEATFGHSGSQSSCAFADPQHGLVVAWICNGQPGELLHQKRARDINTALYEDLGLA